MANSSARGTLPNTSPRIRPDGLTKTVSGRSPTPKRVASEMLARPGACPTGYSALARLTIANAAEADGSLMSIPTKWTFARSASATEAKVPSSAWQATQLDWNQFTTAGPWPMSAEVTRPLPSRLTRSKPGAVAGEA